MIFQPFLSKRKKIQCGKYCKICFFIFFYFTVSYQDLITYNLTSFHNLLTKNMPNILEFIEAGDKSSNNLVVFLQGWPDNATMW